MEEEDDDFYAPNGDAQVKSEQRDGHGNGSDHAATASNNNNDNNNNDDDENMDASDNNEDDDDEEDDDDDSDIDIIVEHKDGTVPEPPNSRSFRPVKSEPVRTASSDPASTSRPQQTPVPKSDPTNIAQPKKISLKDGSKYPEIRSSNIDVNSVPVWSPAGKLITEIDIDADLAEHTKPWRLPGTDQTDYFNYGFDEFTWTQYCLRQQTMSSTINAQKQETKQFEMMLAGGMPPGQAPGGAAVGGPVGPMGAMGMPGMPSEMTPDMMNAMFASMQAQGVSDPSQLDFGAFMQQMQSMGGGMPGMPGMPGQSGAAGAQSMQQQGSNQGYGAQAQYGQQGAQGYGGGTPQPQGQGQQGPMNGFEGYSQQQLAMMQGQPGPPQGPAAGTRGRGRGRRW